MVDDHAVTKMEEQKDKRMWSKGRGQKDKMAKGCGKGPKGVAKEQKRRIDQRMDNPKDSKTEQQNNKGKYKMEQQTNEGKDERE
eukprot:jgi/Psemu1/11836/gm1.11836_g